MSLQGRLVADMIEAAKCALQADSTVPRAQLYRVLRATIARLHPDATEAEVLAALAQLRRVAQVDESRTLH